MVTEIKKMIGMDPEKTCSCCGAFFFEKHLDELGRCHKCGKEGLVPGLKPEEDVIQSDQMKSDNLKSLIRSIVREVLEEDKEAKKVEKAEKSFAQKKCVKCGNMFTPRAPAQKLCDSCHEDLKASQ